MMIRMKGEQLLSLCCCGVVIDGQVQSAGHLLWCGGHLHSDERNKNTKALLSTWHLHPSPQLSENTTTEWQTSHARNICSMLQIHPHANHIQVLYTAACGYVFKNITSDPSHTSSLSTQEHTISRRCKDNLRQHNMNSWPFGGIADSLQHDSKASLYRYAVMGS